MSGPLGEIDGGFRPRLRLVNLALPQANAGERGSGLHNIYYAAGSLPNRQSRSEPRMSLFVLADPDQRNALPDRIHVSLDMRQCMFSSEGARFGMPFTRTLDIPPQGQRDTSSNETPGKIKDVPQLTRPCELILCN